MDFDERYFIYTDSCLRTPVKLQSNLSGHSKIKVKSPPAVPPKKPLPTQKLKRLKGDTLDQHSDSHNSLQSPDN